MSALKTKYKILMFLSSYTPLFLILLLKAISQILEKVQDYANLKIPEAVSENMTFVEQVQIVAQHKTEFISLNIIPLVVIVTIILVIIVPNLILESILRETKCSIDFKDLYVQSVQKMNHIYMEYLVSYIIPFLSFNYSNFFDMVSLLILLFTICIIYINSDLLYVNINFSIRGYNLFKVYTKKQNEYMVLSKEKQLYPDKILKVVYISGSSERIALDTEQEQTE
ncbi:hypothetical protein MSSIH_1351 [Methanosarcina siciliae HI350]|uniref:Uncharacterized protein n=1 Tax=Methanosarcina siciliae HI350 TaxID=1434119 RepID=A0A0E3LAH7_9EURY|nr:hypothetical protein [Methanosarcina siciliae]AKB32041.1 hypothetical protein MSSIH_1351 [Methanosarcina siciliae HI350]